MPDLTLVSNTVGKPITFTVYDQNTGGLFDLTGLTVQLKIDSLDYVTNVLTKTLTVTTPTSGVATWTPIASDWINITNANSAYYGQLVLTQVGVTVMTLQFDIKIVRQLL